MVDSPPLSRSRRDLGADQPGADHDDAAATGERRPQLRRVVEGAQHEHARQPFARQLTGMRPGRDHAGVEVERAVVQLHPAGVDVQTGCW